MIMHGKQEYLNQLSNLKAYHNQLQDSGIKFLFFYAENLDEPKMREEFKVIDVNGQML
jgi:hypothetical protein